MTYGSRLQEALKNAQKTRKHLALELDCSVQILGMVITGAGKIERKLSADNHAKAARFLRVNSYWLATGQGSMSEKEQSTTSFLSRDAIELATMLDEVLDQKQRRVLYAQCVLLLSGGFELIVSPAAAQPIDEPAPDKQKSYVQRPATQL